MNPEANCSTDAVFSSSTSIDQSQDSFQSEHQVCKIITTIFHFNEIDNLHHNT